METGKFGVRCMTCFVARCLELVAAVDFVVYFGCCGSVFFGFYQRTHTACCKCKAALPHIPFYSYLIQTVITEYSGIRLGNTRERGIQPKITCSTCARSLPVIPRLYISYVHSWTIRSPAKWPKNSKNTTFNVLSRSPKSGSTNTIITIRKHTVYRHFLKYKDPIRDE